MGHSMTRVAVVTGEPRDGRGDLPRARQARATRWPCSTSTSEAAQRVAEVLRADGVTALGVAADVSDRAAVEEAFAKVRTELGRCTSWSPAPVRWTEPVHRDHPAGLAAADRRQSHRHLPLLSGRGPDMLEAGWGRIVMISSSSAQRGSPGMAHYAASKGALLSLTKSLAREYGPAGITVQQHSAVGHRDADGNTRDRPRAICPPMSRWRPAFRSGTSARVTTSRRRLASCAPEEAGLSPGKHWASTADR